MRDSATQEKQKWIRQKYDKLSKHRFSRYVLRQAAAY